MAITRSRSQGSRQRRIDDDGSTSIDISQLDPYGLVAAYDDEEENRSIPTTPSYVYEPTSPTAKSLRGA
eukprot:915228-Pyramimonas_sp.AAC.1